MPGCRNCGLLETDERGEASCVKFGAEAIKLDSDADCDYFTKIIMDGALRFSPREHLALKEQERASRRMKGPI